jgi:hypothetical protein
MYLQLPGYNLGQCRPVSAMGGWCMGFVVVRVGTEQCASVELVDRALSTTSSSPIVNLAILGNDHKK